MKLAVILCTLCYVACTYAQSTCSNELGNFMQCMKGKMQEKMAAKKQEKLETMKQCFISNECQPPSEEDLFCTPETCPERGGIRRPGPPFGGSPFGGSRQGAGLSDEQKSCLKQVFLDAIRTKLEECTGDLPDWMFDIDLEKVKPTEDKKRLNREAIVAALESCPAAESCIMALRERRGGKSSEDEEELAGPEGAESEKCAAYNECMDTSFVTCKEEVVKAQTSICGCIDDDSDENDGDDSSSNNGRGRGRGGRGKGGKGGFPFGKGGKGKGFAFGNRNRNNENENAVSKPNFNQEFFKCIAPTPSSVSEARRVKRDMHRGGAKMGHAKAFCKCLA